VAAVTHPDGPDANGKVFEVGAGYVAEIRWERSPGAVFKTNATFTPSAVSGLDIHDWQVSDHSQVKERWSEVTDFSHPT
jgi:multifunctional beta-oxidation protein